MLSFSRLTNCWTRLRTSGRSVTVRVPVARDSDMRPMLGVSIELMLFSMSLRIDVFSSELVVCLLPESPLMPELPFCPVDPEPSPLMPAAVVIPERTVESTVLTSSKA